MDQTPGLCVSEKIGGNIHIHRKQAGEHDGARLREEVTGKQAADQRARGHHQPQSREPRQEFEGGLARRAEDLTSIKGFPRGLAKGEGHQLVKQLRAVVDMPETELQPYPRKRGGGPGRPPPEVEQLAERLKGVRNQKADELGLARGTLLANAVLVEVALAAPTSSEALSAMPGMRRWRVDALGDQLLAVIASQ